VRDQRIASQYNEIAEWKLSNDELLQRLAELERIVSKDVETTQGKTNKMEDNSIVAPPEEDVDEPEVDDDVSLAWCNSDDPDDDPLSSST
jgi:hypothetical protein